jgi:hypothetical protein
LGTKLLCARPVDREQREHARAKPPVCVCTRRRKFLVLTAFVAHLLFFGHIIRGGFFFAFFLTANIGIDFTLRRSRSNVFYAVFTNFCHLQNLAQEQKNPWTDGLIHNFFWRIAHQERVCVGDEIDCIL